MLSRALSRDDLGMPGFLARVITKPSSRPEAGDVTFLSARFLKRLVRVERRDGTSLLPQKTSADARVHESCNSSAGMPRLLPQL